MLVAIERSVLTVWMQGGRGFEIGALGSKASYTVKEGGAGVEKEEEERMRRRAERVKV